MTEETKEPCLHTVDGKLVLSGNGMDLCADFTKSLPRLKPARLRGEMLVKAAGIKGANGPIRIIDATAGFGEDSILLAAAGFEVTMYEYNPVIARLLEDALKRAKEIPELKDIVSHMTFIPGDSIEGMKNLTEAPDVIFLDPMFPERQKSASVKKKFQLLGRLESPCCNEEELLEAALAAHPKKIVIKRPIKGPFLAGRKPDYSSEGKAIRYDCIINIK